jgi:hypothetical protein
MLILRRALTLGLPLFGLACGHERVELPPGLVLMANFEGSARAAAVTEIDDDAEGDGTTYEAGVDGHAVRFDGSGASLDYEGVASLPLGDALTLEFCFNADGWRNPYSKGSILESMVSHSDVFTVALQPDSWLLSARLTAGASEAVALVGGLVTPGTWHHVALVLDPAAGVGRLVFDGEVVAEAPTAGRLPLLEGVPLRLGTWAGKNQAFCGSIDALRLWNRALSNEELAVRAGALPGGSGS